MVGSFFVGLPALFLQIKKSGFTNQQYGDYESFFIILFKTCLTPYLD
ncbi:hypothetical protein DSOL_3246 [Desulfosporosinus metallidurans]|uniref:Uncharacterized protein n=1 Tax=Desulfosporosinus metallidurans TaxID=1888891 RepID=A0A1Q8QRY5_9FIRM|nr:hypothetical protein DSOL_3246 [Desulfosporosinus metallidurans]